MTQPCGWDPGDASWCGAVDPQRAALSPKIHPNQPSISVRERSISSGSEQSSVLLPEATSCEQQEHATAAVIRRVKLHALRCSQERFPGGRAVSAACCSLSSRPAIPINGCDGSWPSPNLMSPAAPATATTSALPNTRLAAAHTTKTQHPPQTSLTKTDAGGVGVSRKGSPLPSFFSFPSTNWSALCTLPDHASPRPFFPAIAPTWPQASRGHARGLGPI
ncbi:hypothetical protein BU16DRAFT_193044 [Lophium mytilinum]|uniref:Uncharacterized protein n=1 Tax=Lophium mytilinum TaxID=390894 RepID=A0A6A6R9Y0_9PEZI|nr:hypothetical protein BU16DRAFT_193044 [Lophium mytilinum]